MEALSDALARMVRRQDELDQRLARIEAALFATRPVAAPPPAPVAAAPPAPQQAPPPVVTKPVPPPLPQAPPHTPPQTPPSPRKPAFETNIGLTLVNRIGVITLVLGVAFFFKWAVDNQWIGPVGRVALGVIAGLLTLAAGEWLWRRRGQQIFAQGVTGTGICILYLAVYAAFGFYHLLPQPPAFVFMAVVTGIAAALSLRYNAVAIAALGMFGGYITPIVLSTGEDHPWFLFTYVLILDLGALALARIRPWAVLNALGFLATVVLYCLWFGERFHSGKEAVATVYAIVFYALFASTLIRPLFPIAQVLAALAIAAIWSAAPLPFFLLTLALIGSGFALAELRRSQAMLLSAFGGAWVAFAAWHSDLPSHPPLGPIFAGITCVFLLFFGWVAFWTVVARRQARTAELIVLALNGLIYFTAGYTLLHTTYGPWMGLFAAVIGAVHLALGWFIWSAEQAADMNALSVAVGFAVVYATLAIPIQFTGYRITIAWAVEGAALTWIGRRLHQSRLRMACIAVFALVVLRLATLDAWTFDDPASYSALWNRRFLTFLISTAALWLAAWWTKERAVALAYYLAGHIVLLVALSMEDLGWAFRNATASNLASVETVSLSILWALYAVALVACGVLWRFALNRLLGLVLLGLVVLKLYVYDVWQVARVFRITAFVALGILLIATSYLYSRYRGALENWLKDDQSRAEP